MRPLHSLSKRTMQVIAILFLLVIVASVYLQVLWADWAIKSIFDKDVNNWLILLALFVFEILTPKSLRGLSTIILFLMTLYIWCVL